MKRIVLLLTFFGTSFSLCAQFKHLDYLGAGHNNFVEVTSSSSSVNTSATQTVAGFPIQNQEQLKDASRFLAQATMGADYATIAMTAAMGYEAWLDEQFQLPQISLLDEMVSHARLYTDEEFEEFEDFFVYFIYFNSAWTSNNLSTPDLLRQRMAFVWSQIMVINYGSDFFEDVGQTLGAYYDMLSANSFENYHKLLTDVTLSPAMGNFLSHYNNPKADPTQNIHPDENYAREIMQLFSIGLWQLNQDGSRVYDASGNFIPTYTNANIKEFAQVFTGLGDGLPTGEFGLPVSELAENAQQIMVTPMKMYNEYHDRSEKQLLNGYVIPANQDGMTDINLTINHLADHPNTAPFISKSLIKFLTTSNPSPDYVSAVAASFNPAEPNNFQQVIRTILLHPRARNCTPTPGYTFGKLREPVLRLMNTLRSFPLKANENNDYPFMLECFSGTTGQSPLAAPSVFNFFLPDYQPQGSIGQAYLTAPEFQILNATNAIGLVNEADFRVVREQYFSSNCVGEEWEEEEEEEEMEEEEEEEEEEADEGELNTEVDFSILADVMNNPTELINKLDIIVANGLLQDNTKQIIVDAISQLEQPVDQLRMALYLILISPDYAILK